MTKRERPIPDEIEREWHPSGCMSIILAPVAAIANAFGSVIPDGSGMPFHVRAAYFLLNFRTWIAVLAIGVAAYFIYPQIVKSPETAESDRSTESEATISAIDTLLADGSTNEILNEVRALSAGFGKASVPEKISRVDKQMKLLTRLEENDREGKHAEEILLYKLISLVSFESVSFANNIQQEQYSSELSRLADAHQTHSNSQIKFLANMAQCIAKLRQFSVEGSDQNFEEFKTQLGAGLDSLGGEVANAKRLMAISDQFGDLASQKQDNEIKALIGSRLTKNSNPEIAALGNNMRTRSLLGNVSIVELKRKILRKDNDGIIDARKYIQSVLNSNPTVFEFCQALLLVDAFQQAGFRKQAAPIYDSLFVAAEKMGAQGNEEIASLGKDFKRLYHCRGTQVKLAMTDDEGTRFENKSGGPVVIFFFSLKGSDSRDLMPVIKNLSETYNEVAFIGCAVDVDSNSQSRAQPVTNISQTFSRVRNANQRVFWASTDSAAKLIEQFPVYSAPYLVVLDGSNSVVQTNINMSRLRRGLELMLKSSQAAD